MASDFESVLELEESCVVPAFEVPALGVTPSLLEVPVEFAAVVPADTVEAAFPLVAVVVEVPLVPLVVLVEVPVVPLVVLVEVVVVEVPLVVLVEVVAVEVVPLVGSAVMVSSFTTPLLKSCSLAIKTFIGSIESLGNLQVTVLVMPIFVAVTSAHAPSGFLGCTCD